MPQVHDDARSVRVQRPGRWRSQDTDRGHETGDRPEPESGEGGPPEHDGVEGCDPEQQRLDEQGGGVRHDKADGQTRSDRPQSLCTHMAGDARPRGAQAANPAVTCSRNRRTATLSASTSSSTRGLLTGSSGSKPRTDSRTEARTVPVSAPPRATTVTFCGASSQYGRYATRPGSTTSEPENPRVADHPDHLLRGAVRTVPPDESLSDGILLGPEPRRRLLGDDRDRAGAILLGDVSAGRLREGAEYYSKRFAVPDSRRPASGTRRSG